MSRLIALVGKMGSGKDTAAQALTTRAWVRVGFADALKELALRVNPIIIPSSCLSLTLRMAVGEHGWEEAKRYYPGIRRLLQDLGVGARDICGDYTWIRIATGQAAALLMGGTSVVITDCRFKNEASTVRGMGGAVVRIIRPEPEKDSVTLGQESGHVSETELDGIHPDITIINDGTIQELQEKLLAFSETMKPSYVPMVQSQ